MPDPYPDQLMSELLVDELTGDHVILAPARALRPDTFRVHGEVRPPSVDDCPFCAGNEHETPPEVARIGPGRPGEPGWRVRVVPNKYPIVDAHEVVILSPAHDADFGALDDAAATDVVRMLRDRCAFHLAQGRSFAQAFLNHGRAAGASIEHPHAQVVALDIVPARVQTRCVRFSAAAFTRDQEHVVRRDDGVVVWCPPASSSPFMQRCALADAGPRFDLLTDDDVAVVAVGLRDTLARLRGALGDVAYNAMIETAPRDHTAPFQWWIDIVPRVAVIAGFELGTGIGVNIVAPADAAAALRAAQTTSST